MTSFTIIGGGVAGLAALLILLNWVGLIAFAVNHEREPARSGYSFAPPFICGPILAAIWALGPALPLRRYAWIAILLDPSILLLLLAPVLSALGKLVRPGRGSREG